MKKILKEILTKLGLQFSDIEEEKLDDHVRLNIVTEVPAEFIGAGGKTLVAVQHMLRVFLWRKNISGYVTVDVDNYKKKQEENVIEFARKAADKVVSLGRPQELPEMGSDKRRIVHKFISETYPELVTESLGESYNRRVIVRKKT